jgi:hypothetical protein
VADGPDFSTIFADVNSDGHVDLITTTNSEVRALDMVSGVTLWERDTIHQTPSIGSVYHPTANDFDGDGTIELAWANAGYSSGVVAISVPLVGAPRWRSDFKQSYVADSTLVRRAGGSSSIAYLTYATQELPGLGTLGFLDGSTFADQGGSDFSWLPGYDGFGRTVRQHAITSLPLDGIVDAVVVAGAEYPIFGGDPIARWLWTFDGNGALQSSRALMSSTDPQRIATAQVLDRPERQLVVAGWMPQGASGPHSARVEIVDYSTGNVLWQSVPLPTYDGSPITKLDVADLDADGQLEIVVAYGKSVAILNPSTSSDVVAEYAAQQFSLLDRGVGRNAKFATLRGTHVAVYDGLSATPEKTFVLPDWAYCIALFTQAPDDVLMFVTGNYLGLTLRRYADGEILASSNEFLGFSLSAMDIDGDHRIEIVSSGEGFNIWRLDNDYVFRDGFDEHAPATGSAWAMTKAP